MTDLAARTTRLRFTTASEVREAGRYRRVVAEARPEYLIIKASGLHSCYNVTWEAIWSLAVKMKVAAEKAEKKAARKKSS